MNRPYKQDFTEKKRMQLIAKFPVCKLRSTQNSTTYFQGQMYVCVKGR